MAAHVIVLVINIIALSLALAGNVTALTGYSWWKINGGDVGLWRTCKEDSQGDWKCIIGKNIFDFDEPNLDKTIVIILLIVSSGMLFASLMSSLLVCFCLEKRCGWICGAAALCVQTFIGGGAGFVAHIYAEVQLKETFSLYERGWTNIAGWVGSAIGVVTFFISIVMICVKPKLQTGIRDYGNDFTNRAYQI